MDKHKQTNESILLGYFTGTLSIPLQQEVEDWISASEENKKIAKERLKMNYAIILSGGIGTRIPWETNYIKTCQTCLTVFGYF